MNRSELESYLKQLVSLELHDGSTYSGVLYKTGDEVFRNRAEFYLPKNYYVLMDDKCEASHSCIFKLSHVKGLKTNMKYLIGDKLRYKRDNDSYWKNCIKYLHCEVIDRDRVAEDGLPYLITMEMPNGTANLWVREEELFLEVPEEDK